MLGYGTQNDPYIIQTPQDLHNTRNNLNAYYELGNNIDMSAWGNFSTIAKTTSFKGKFDGKGFKIKKLTINETSGNIGLFGSVDSSTTVIKNLGIEECNISGGNTGNWAGGIVGFLLKGNIENCYVTGHVTGQYMVGGIIGQFYDGSIKNSFSKTNVIGTGRVGGLVGYTGSSTCLVENCYSTGVATHTQIGTDYPSGGLIGNMEIPAKINNSFWDIESSGLTISQGGTGKTTSQMKQQSTFLNWNFTSIWSITNDYPYLQVFGAPVAPPKKESISVISNVKSITSLANKVKNSTKESQIYINSILGNSERYTATLRACEGNLSQINTNATQSHRTVRSRIENVNSSISSIHSTFKRESKTIKKLLAEIKPIEGYVSVVYPLSNKVVNAYLNVHINPSRTYMLEGKSETFYIINPSFGEVME